jgi:hypothetical protein
MLERQLVSAAEELRDSCQQLTAASASLTAAANENAEKDATVALLKAKIAELDDKAVADALVVGLYT